MYTLGQNPTIQLRGNYEINFSAGDLSCHVTGNGIHVDYTKAYGD